MEIKRIKKIFEENRKIIFSFDPEALHYIRVDLDAHEIWFTTDNNDYIMAGKLENALEIINKRFNLTSFRVEFHVHKGDLHDKNIIINTKNKDILEISKIIKFIMDNFF